MEKDIEIMTDDWRNSEHAELIEAYTDVVCLWLVYQGGEINEQTLRGMQWLVWMRLDGYKANEEDLNRKTLYWFRWSFRQQEEAVEAAFEAMFPGG